jgi:hypothetical protein
MCIMYIGPHHLPFVPHVLCTGLTLVPVIWPELLAQELGL